MWEKHRETHLKAPRGLSQDRPSRQHQRDAAARAAGAKSKKPAADSVYAILDTILPVPKNGAKPTAQAIVSTEREFYNPIPECKLLVDLARRVSNTRTYGERLKKKGIDPKTIWATTKAKKYKFFETLREGFPGSSRSRCAPTWSSCSPAAISWTSRSRLEGRELRTAAGMSPARIDQKVTAPGLTHPADRASPARAVLAFVNVDAPSRNRRRRRRRSRRGSRPGSSRSGR